MCHTRVICAVIAAILAGCATAPGLADQSAAAGRAGDLAQAERLAVAAIRAGDQPGKAWHNLGVALARTGRPAQAEQAFTMSARYGYADAQLALAREGRPVPAADLVPRPGVAAPSLADAALKGYLDGLARGAADPGPGRVDCTSTARGAGRVDTSCRTQ